MFTLGNKEAIVNSTTQFPFTPATANVDILNIKGFGTFSQARLTRATGRRASAAKLGRLAFTNPTAAQLGIAATEVGVSVIVHLRVNSSRTASEGAIDFIKRGRPMILEIKVDGGQTAAQIAATVLSAFNEYSSKFNTITLPVTAAISGDDIILTTTEGFYQISEGVTFLKRGDIFAYNAVTTSNFATALTINDIAIAGGDTTIILSALTGLAVGDNIQFLASPTVDRTITEIVTGTNTITFTPALAAAGDAANGDLLWLSGAGAEAINDGKYLEEAVRMSFAFTEGAYIINPGQVPIIGGSYTMISWHMDTLNAWGGWQIHDPTDIKSAEFDNHMFTLYFLEDGAWSATSQVKYLVDWLVGGAPSIGDFKLATGQSAITTANFLA